VKAPIEVIEELEGMERLRWSFRLRRRAIAGLVAVYAMAISLGVFPARLSAAAFILIFFCVNEYRQYRFDRGFVRPTTIGYLAIEIFGVYLMIYATGGVHSPVIPLSVMHVVAVSIHINYSMAWRAAYLATLFFSIGNVLEYLEVIPHAPMFSESAMGGLARGAGLSFNVLLVACLTYGFLLSISAYASGYITSKLKIRENLLQATHQMLASIYKLSSVLLTLVDPADIARTFAEWIVEELSLTRAVVCVQSSDGTVQAAAYPRPLFDEGEMARLTSIVQPGDQAKPGEGVSRTRTASSRFPRVSGQFHAFDAYDIESGSVIVARVLIDASRELSSEERSMLQAALNHFRTTVEKSRYVSEALSLATRDGLTRIPNRRFFTQSLGREVSRSVRHRLPLSLVLIDVDFFKKVNDIHGHLTGDQVLKDVASILVNCTRDTDVAARFGGEEFAVLAPQTDLDSGLKVAERIRAQVAKHPFEANGVRFVVTISLGVAEYHADQAEGPDGLIAIADRRLYLAKHAGRDRVVVRD